MLFASLASFILVKILLGMIILITIILVMIILGIAKVSGVC